MGLKVAGGAPQSAAVKLSQGDMADSIARGICIECNSKTKKQKIKPNYEQPTIMTHVK